MRRLSNDEKVVSLKTAWDQSNTFFQFSVLVRWPLLLMASLAVLR